MVTKKRTVKQICNQDYGMSVIELSNTLMVTRATVWGVLSGKKCKTKRMSRDLSVLRKKHSEERLRKAKEEYENAKEAMKDGES